MSGGRNLEHEQSIIYWIKLKNQSTLKFHLGNQGNSDVSCRTLVLLIFHREFVAYALSCLLGTFVAAITCQYHCTTCTLQTSIVRIHICSFYTPPLKSGWVFCDRLRDGRAVGRAGGRMSSFLIYKITQILLDGFWKKIKWLYIPGQGHSI